MTLTPHTVHKTQIKLIKANIKRFGRWSFVDGLLTVHHRRCIISDSFVTILHTFTALKQAFIRAKLRNVIIFFFANGVGNLSIRTEMKLKWCMIRHLQRFGLLPILTLSLTSTTHAPTLAFNTHNMTKQTFQCHVKV